MSSRRLRVPEGVQDILGGHCRTKRRIERDLRGLFDGYAYEEIETPTYEYLDVFAHGGGEGGFDSAGLARFIGPDGGTYALRPDMTVPAARVVAARHAGGVGVRRISYVGQVFRFGEYGGGRHSEYTQAGAEVFGSPSPEADAEVVALAIKALKAIGLVSFQIDVGQVGFFEGLLDVVGSRCDLGPGRRAAIMEAIDRKNAVGLREEFAKGYLDAGGVGLLTAAEGLYGDVGSVTSALGRMELGERSREAGANARGIIEAVKDYGLGEYICMDLTMLKGSYYDSGFIFRGYAQGVGFPILLGGRYDGLTGSFGKATPATGFSMGLDLAMAALQRQDGMSPQAVGGGPREVLIGCGADAKAAGVSVADGLRRLGCRVETWIVGGPTAQGGDAGLPDGTDAPRSPNAGVGGAGAGATGDIGAYAPTDGARAWASRNGPTSGAAGAAEWTRIRGLLSEAESLGKDIAVYMAGEGTALAFDVPGKA
ncbi:MAG: ATP phosphoribosyltransferase regulatory subunit, partial [Oscillospiraceae bacterium]|nr:ATP phosphoribosyltransferase regulatory subunit [Oscillospiraceae bacterium]